jgi:hypothetical protein
MFGAASAPFLFVPRLATGFGEAAVKAYNSHTREYTANALALYLRLQTKIPEGAVAAPPRDGLEEMFSSGGMQSSEGAKAVVEAKQRASKLEVLVGQLRRRVVRAEKKVSGRQKSSSLEGRCRHRQRRIAGALLGKCAKGAEALRDQTRLRDHV